MTLSLHYSFMIISYAFILCIKLNQFLLIIIFDLVGDKQGYKMKELEFHRKNKKSKRVNKEELSKYKVRKRVEEILEDRKLRKEFEL